MNDPRSPSAGRALVPCPSCGALVRPPGGPCYSCQRTARAGRPERPDDGAARLRIPRMPDREAMAAHRRVRDGEGRRWR